MAGKGTFSKRDITCHQPKCAARLSTDGSFDFFRILLTIWGLQSKTMSKIYHHDRLLRVVAMIAVLDTKLSPS